MDPLHNNSLPYLALEHILMLHRSRAPEYFGFNARPGAILDSEPDCSNPRADLELFAVPTVVRVQSPWQSLKGPHQVAHPGAVR